MLLLSRHELALRDERQTKVAHNYERFHRATTIEDAVSHLPCLPPNHSLSFSMPRFLTKSRFKMALECPTKLAYTGNPAFVNARSGDAFMQALADGGFQVGELAKLMHPGGVEVTAAGHEEALRQTNVLLERDEVTIFEAAVCFNNLFVRIDVLKKTGNRLEVIEVKAKSYDAQESFFNKSGAIRPPVLPYLQDVAFQVFVLRSAFPQFEVSAYLMMADKGARATVDQLSQKFKIVRSGHGHSVEIAPSTDASTIGSPLLAKIGVNVHVEKILGEPVRFPGGELGFAEAVATFSEHYERNTNIEPVIGAHCGKCEFRTPLPSKQSGFHTCWKTATGWDDEHFKDGTVLDLWNFRGKGAMIRMGVFGAGAVTKDDLKLSDGNGPLTHGDRQWMQVSGEWPGGGEYFLDRDGLREVEAGWNYPLHFIDFETSRTAIPFHVGRKPYEQVAFQFSHHLMTAEGKVTHAGQFLEAAPGIFPNYAFVRELRRQTCGDNGTILRWASHENSVLRDIWHQLDEDIAPPDDKDELQSYILDITTENERVGNRTMVDLCKLAEHYYFHPVTKGSCSIKKVLPAVLQSSSLLRDRYSAPVYGSETGPTSLNFKNWSWWQPQAGSDTPCDPYRLLEPVYQNDGLGSAGEAEADDTLSDGGAAMNAYGRLQFETLSTEERERLCLALLKYCELDTLAMVMIWQAWKSDLARTEDIDSSTPTAETLIMSQTWNALSCSEKIELECLREAD